MGTPVILNWTPPLTTWHWESRWEVDLNTILFVHEFLLYFGSFPSDLFNIIRTQLLRKMVNLQRFLLVVIKSTVQTGFVNCFLPQWSGLNLEICLRETLNALFWANYSQFKQRLHYPGSSSLFAQDTAA